MLGLFACQCLELVLIVIVKNSLVTDAHDSTTATEAVIEAAKVDGADAELAQDRGAHDAWLDGDIQVGLLENLGFVFGQDLAQGHELGMAGALETSMLEDDREKRGTSIEQVLLRWHEKMVGQKAQGLKRGILIRLLTFMVMLVPFMPLAMIFPS